MDGSRITVSDDLLRPREAAARLGVHPKTLSRWESLGHLPCVRTPGGHRRFRRSDIDCLRDWLRGETSDDLPVWLRAFESGHGRHRPSAMSAALHGPSL